MQSSHDSHASHGHPTKDDMPAEAVELGEEATAVDPVCGMTVAVKPDTR